jgi:hypothetical protein
MSTLLVVAGLLAYSSRAADRMADLPVFFGGPTRMNASGQVELIAYFNEVAREDDGYFLTESSLLTDPTNHLAAISQIQEGRVVQNFASWQTAAEQLHLIVDLVDVIFYDLEHWEQSRDEWQDIELASQSMAAIAAAHGLFYIGHLSNRLADRNDDDPLSIEHMAAHADAYNATAYPCLEMFSMDECLADMREMIFRAKSANPQGEIHVGISLEKQITLVQQYEYIEGNLDLTDSISIFAYPNRPNSVQRLKDFIALLRDRPPTDFDFDFDVDLDDFGLFQACISGPAIPHDGTTSCRRADLDGDSDVDLSDFGAFQRCLSGDNVPADPACAEP